jgi:hypothetical protein
MEERERKILHLRFGLALLKVLEERNNIAKVNKSKGIKDHRLVSSLRKLAAASAIDYGSVQKISKGDQGLEFFTFIDLIDALDLDMVQFGQYFYSITDEEVKEYQIAIQKIRKENKQESKKKAGYKKKTTQSKKSSSIAASSKTKNP